MLDLCTKAREHIKTLFESPENEVESLRLKTDFYARMPASALRAARPDAPPPQEMIVSQHNNFTLVVIQMEEVAIPVAVTGEKKEGEGEEKKEA